MAVIPTILRILGMVAPPFGLMFLDHELSWVYKLFWYLGSFVLVLIFGWLGRPKALNWAAVSFLIATETIFSRMLYYGIISNPFENSGVDYHPVVGAIFGYLFCFFINLPIVSVFSGSLIDTNDVEEYLGKFWFIGLLTIVIAIWF